MKKTIVTLSDSNYFPLLEELIHSIRKFKESEGVDICVLDAGLTPVQIEKISTLVDEIKILHPKHTKLCFRNWRIQRRKQRQIQYIPRSSWIDDPVIPKARTGMMSVSGFTAAMCIVEPMSIAAALRLTIFRSGWSPVLRFVMASPPFKAKGVGHASSSSS